MSFHVDNVSLPDLDFSALPELTSLDWQSYEPYIHFPEGSEWEFSNFLNTPLDLNQQLDVSPLSQDVLSALQTTTPERPISEMNQEELCSRPEASTRKPERIGIAKKKRSRPEREQQLQGFFRFSLNSEGPAVPQRAPTALRNAERNRIPKIRACLRCQFLKKPVSVYFIMICIAPLLIVL